MASAPQDPGGNGVADADRVAALEAELRRSERRREAAEEWGEFLADELEARDELLECIIEQYEAQLMDAKERSGGHERAGLWARLTGWILG